VDFIEEVPVAQLPILLGAATIAPNATESANEPNAPNAVKDMLCVILVYGLIQLRNFQHNSYHL